MFDRRPARRLVAQHGRVALLPLPDLNRAEWRRLHGFYRSPELAAWNAARPTRLPRWLFRLSLLSDEGSGERFSFGVLDEGGELIGTAELYDLAPPLPATPQRATLGVMLAPDRWGHGYGREAVTALLSWGFGAGLQRVQLTTLEHNRRAQRSFAACGFRETARRGQPPHGEVHMELTRAEWQARQEAAGQTRPRLSSVL